MVSNEKPLKINDLTGKLIYRASAIESELGKGLKKWGHPLSEPRLETKDYDTGGSFSGRGFFFYFTRNTDALDRKGTRITYGKGAWKNGRAFEELVREEIERSKHESIKLRGDNGYLSLDFRFISNSLAETINGGTYESVQYLKKAYNSYFLESDLKDKRILLPDIRQALKSKSINEIIDFIICSIDYDKASRN